MRCRGWSHSFADALSPWSLVTRDRGGVRLNSEYLRVQSLARSSMCSSLLRFHGSSSHLVWLLISMPMTSKRMFIVERRRQDMQWIGSKRSSTTFIGGCIPTGSSSILIKRNLFGLETGTSSRKSTISLCRPDIQEPAFQKSVVNLGVTLDQELTLSSHIGNTCRSGFYQLRQLRLIRRHLTDKTAATLVHAFVMSRVDYCNAVLIGIAKQQMSRLQMILNTAARLLLRIPRFRAHLVGNHEHSALASRAQTRDVQSVLPGLELCRGNWSSIPTRAVCLVGGGLGPPTPVVGHVIVEGAVLSFCNNSATWFCYCWSCSMEWTSSTTATVIQWLQTYIAIQKTV